MPAEHLAGDQSAARAPASDATLETLWSKPAAGQRAILTVATAGAVTSEELRFSGTTGFRVEPGTSFANNGSESRWPGRFSALPSCAARVLGNESTRWS